MSRGKMGLSKRIALLLVFVFSCTCGLVLLPQKAVAVTFEQAREYGRKINGYGLALKADGNVVSWDSNGDLRPIPERVQSDVAAVYQNGGVFLAVKNNGSVVAWGNNNNRQCTVPVELQGKDVVYFGPKDLHPEYPVALTADGYLIKWGKWYSEDLFSMAKTGTVYMDKEPQNSEIRLGSDGKVYARGPNSNWVGTNVFPPSNVHGENRAVANGVFHYLVLKNNGCVKAFGNYWFSRGYDYGQCNIPPLAQSGIVYIVAAENHSLALRVDGRVVAWGQYNKVPATIQGKTVTISVGGRRCMALLSDGEVVAWDITNGSLLPVPVGLNLLQGSLTNLIIGNGNLSPSFNPDILNYTVNVEELTSTNVTAVTANPATHNLRINGSEQSSGVPKEIPLTEGSNTIKIDVDVGGILRTYTISVNNVCKPKAVSAATTTDGKKILLTFDKEMKTPPVSPAGFSVFVNGINNPITAVNLNATNKKVIELTLTNKIYKNNINIGVAYIPGTVMATDGTKLAGFNMGVVNKSATYGTYNIFSAATSTDGNKIFLTCEKEMNSLPASPAGFTVSVKGTANPITAVTLNNTNKKIIELTLNRTILKNHVDIKVSYTPGTVTATDGTKLAVCSGLSVTNNSKITFGSILSLKFDEGSGAIAHDTSGFGNSGILNENVNWCKGIKGNGAYFTGVDSSVAVPHASLNNLSNWTFEAWVKPESSGYIYTEGNPWETMILGITGDNGLQISTWHGSRTGRWAHYTTTADLLTRHKWNHLVVTLANGGAGAKSGVVTCYVNGRCVATESLGSVSNETTKEAEVGRNVGFKEGQNANALKGIIDEVAIYSRVLSAEEIQQNYQKIIYLDNIKITNADDKETPEPCTFGAHMSKLEFDLKKSVNELTLGLDLPSNIKVVSVENIYKNGAKIENFAVITADGHEIKFTKPLAVGSYQLDLLFNIDGELVVKTEFYIDKEKNKTNYASEKFELQFMEFDDLPDIL